MFKKVLKFGGIGCGGFLALTLILAVILAITGGGEEQTQPTAPDSQAATSDTGEENSSADSPTLAVTPGAIPTTDECPTIAEEMYLRRQSNAMVAMLAELEILSSLSYQAANDSMVFHNSEWITSVVDMLKRMETNADLLRRFDNEPESVRDLHSDMDRMGDLLDEVAERFRDGINLANAQHSGMAEDAFEDVGDAVKEIMELADSAGDKFQDFCR